jgi:hypothetical protein
MTESSVALPPEPSEQCMTSATEFRQFAEECLRSAELAKTEQERKAFLDMARAWTQAAVGTGERIAGIVKQGDKSSH